LLMLTCRTAKKTQRLVARRARYLIMVERGKAHSMIALQHTNGSSSRAVLVVNAKHKGSRRGKSLVAVGR
jgi:hypothetical protein